MIPLLRKCLVRSFANHRSGISCSISIRFLSSISDEGHSVSSPAMLDLFLRKYQFSPEVASKAASNLNLLKDLKKSDSVLSSLKEMGFSNSQLEKIFKYRPRLLVPVGTDDGIIPKVRALQNLGIPPNTTAKLLSSNPAILASNLDNRVIPNFYKLRNFLGAGDVGVAEILSKSGRVLLFDLERTMFRNIDFLKSCNISMDRLLKLLYSYPRCLLVKPEVLRMSLEKVEKMGVDRSTNSFIDALRVVSSHSAKSWELKLQALEDCGFSKSDLRKMFVRCPQVFSCSAENLKSTKEVLLATGKYDLSCIVTYPTSLYRSVEKRYKPRFCVLEILEGKNLIKSWPSLGVLCSTPNDKFFKKFVHPYVKDIDGEVYIGKDFVNANG